MVGYIHTYIHSLREVKAIGGHRRPTEVEYRKETCMERDGVHRRP